MCIASDNGRGRGNIFCNYALKRQHIIFCRGKFLASKLGLHLFGFVGGPGMAYKIYKLMIRNNASSAALPRVRV